MVCRIFERRSKYHPVMVPHADREAAAALHRAWTGGTSADRRCIALSLQVSPMLAASLPFADALRAVQTDLQASGAGWPDLV